MRSASNKISFQSRKYITLRNEHSLQDGKNSRFLSLLNDKRVTYKIYKTKINNKAVVIKYNENLTWGITNTLVIRMAPLSFWKTIYTAVWGTPSLNSVVFGRKSRLLPRGLVLIDCCSFKDIILSDLIDGTDAALLKSVLNDGVEPVLPILNCLVLFDVNEGVSRYS